VADRPTLSDGIRSRLKAQAMTCPTCHQPTVGGGVRGLADKIGVGHSTLWRFINGQSCNSDLLDKVEAWLHDNETQAEEIEA
jgi:hypothetical protein